METQYPDLDAVRKAVIEDYKKNPDGFAERAIDQVASFLVSDSNYYNLWCRTVILTASVCLGEDKSGS